MLDLIKYIVNQFAEDKENIDYEVNEKDRVIEVVVTLPSSDMGKVIGKQGKSPRRCARSSVQPLPETARDTSSKSKKRAATP